MPPWDGVIRFENIDEVGLVMWLLKCISVCSKLK